MRVREKIESGQPWKQINCWPVAGAASFYSSSSTAPWNYNFGPNRRRYDSISDELSPEHVYPRPFNRCTHIKCKAAEMSYDVLSTFDDPRLYPPLPIHVACPIMFDKLGYPKTSVSYGSMIDELASLAEGTTSNSAMLPVTLLEGAKTIAMMRNPFNLLKPNFRRKARKLTARVLASASANVWLEGYYGWKSLYQDTEQIAKATASFLNDDHSRYLEKLGERLSVTQTDKTYEKVLYQLGTSETAWLSDVNPDGSLKVFRPKSARTRAVDVHHTISTTIGCRQFIATQARLNRTISFLNAYGLNGLNWRTVRDTIWEVIPFSFVIDWFVDTRGLWAPINRWRLGQTDIKRLGHSTVRISSYDVEMYPVLNPFFWSGTYYGAIPNSWRLSSVVRSIGRGSNSSYTRAPGFPSGFSEEVSFNTKGLSFIRSVNGLALITQLVGGRR